MEEPQRGAVLIMVLWVIALLSMIGGYFSLETTLRRNMAFGTWNLFRARLAVESALSLLSPHIVRLGNDEDVEEGDEFVVPDGSVYQVEIGGQILSFSIEDERGKMDVNRATEEELNEFFSSFLGKEQGRQVAESILDWRDNDDDERPSGAEKDYYASLNPPYETANSRFLLLEQLLLVKGVSPELFWGPVEWAEPGSEGAADSWKGGLQDLLTVYNGDERIIEEVAPQPLIDILGKEYFKDAQGLGTLRFKTCVYQSCYQIFFRKEPGAKTGFRLVHWQQVPRFD